MHHSMRYAGKEDDQKDRDGKRLTESDVGAGEKAQDNEVFDEFDGEDRIDDGVAAQWKLVALLDGACERVAKISDKARGDTRCSTEGVLGGVVDDDGGGDSGEEQEADEEEGAQIEDTNDDHCGTVEDVTGTVVDGEQRGSRGEGSTHGTDSHPQVLFVLKK